MQFVALLGEVVLAKFHASRLLFSFGLIMAKVLAAVALHDSCVCSLDFPSYFHKSYISDVKYSLTFLGSL